MQTHRGFVGLSRLVDSTSPFVRTQRHAALPCSPTYRTTFLLFAQLLIAVVAWSQTNRRDSSKYEPGDDPQPPTASAYVPLDSYVYPLFDRLAAEGLMDTSFAGIRPWTREQCARLVEEAEETVNDDAPAFTLSVLRALKTEFKPELEPYPSRSRMSLDNVYTRTTSITGSSILDPHFGQTLINDYGRRSGEGANALFGFEATQLFGPVVMHVRSEFQALPGSPLLPPNVQQFIRTADKTPTRQFRPQDSSASMSLIEAYAGVKLRNTDITVGKQTLWWGPSPNGTLLFSTNAEPIYMVRLSQNKPQQLPWIFKYLGPMRWDAFFGKLSGHEFPRNPYLHGQKISFKPTRNIEFGFSRTVIFAGDGHPLTFKRYWRSFVSVGDNPSTAPGSNNDVGDRRGGFDFKYRLPKLRDRVTLYGDFFTDDDPSPLAAPHRSAMIPGLYIAKLPYLERADLRVEAFSTAAADVSNLHGRFFYFNDGYRDGYTNDGQLLGSWIGRDSKAILATSRYWISATTNVALSYRNVKLSTEYVPQGGTQHDMSGTFDAVFGQFRTSAFVQYEQWKIPLLSSSVRRNVTVSFQLSFMPGVLRPKGGK